MMSDVGPSETDSDDGIGADAPTPPCAVEKSANGQEPKHFERFKGTYAIIGSAIVVGLAKECGSAGIHWLEFLLYFSVAGFAGPTLYPEFIKHRYGKAKFYFLLFAVACITFALFLKTIPEPPKYPHLEISLTDWQGAAITLHLTNDFLRSYGFGQITSNSLGCVMFPTATTNVDVYLVVGNEGPIAARMAYIGCTFPTNISVDAGPGWQVVTTPQDTNGVFQSRAYIVGGGILSGDTVRVPALHFKNIPWNYYTRKAYFAVTMSARVDDAPARLWAFNLCFMLVSSNAFRDTPPFLIEGIRTNGTQLLVPLSEEQKSSLSEP